MRRGWHTLLAPGGRDENDGGEVHRPLIQCLGKVPRVAAMETTGQTHHVFPMLPDLGEEDTYYGKIAHKAEKKGDIHKRAAYKVAQYITLAKDPPLSWPEKLKYFQIGRAHV